MKIEAILKFISKRGIKTADCKQTISRKRFFRIMSIRKRLYYLLALIFIVHLIGSTGYYIIFDGEPEFLDCLYMTVVSLTTVGYGEVIEVSGNDTAQI